jgi:alkylation response protein AidB-like acyl-CoA dehydrogenase
MTTVTAGLIDRGLEDYMLETAILKVFTTEALWSAVNESFQIHGGAAYFTDRPLERMLRDARINQIGEGANEVLTSFIALVGMRGPGKQFQDIWEGLQHGKFSQVARLGWERLGAATCAPEVRVQREALRPFAEQLGQLICQFSREVDRALIHHREEILERQYLQARIARAAMNLFASACVLSRWDAAGEPDDVPVLFLRNSFRGIEQALAELHDNEDVLVTAVADQALGKGPT